MSAKSSLARKEKWHRYKVWLLAEDQPCEATPIVRQLNPLSKPISKLTDLETLLLLYNYGRPIEMVVEATCKLPNGASAKYTSRKISSEAVDFAYNDAAVYTQNTPHLKMAIGTPLSFDLDGIGDVKGVLTSQNDDGFQVTVHKDCRSILAEKLAHMAVESGIAYDATSPILNNAPRIEPLHSDCTFTDYKGRLRQGKIVSLSQFDALIRIAAASIPPNGTRIVFRGPEWHGAEVAITFEIGFIAKFCVPIPAERFSPDLRFTDD